MTTMITVPTITTTDNTVEFVDEELPVMVKSSTDITAN